MRVWILKAAWFDIPAFGVQALFRLSNRRMRTSAVLGTVVLISTFANADPAVIIRERAKELSNQNNVRQGVAPPTQPAQPTVTPAAPQGPTISPALMRFNTDIAAIKADAQITPDQQQKLSLELIASAQGPKPSLASVSKLAADVSAAFSEKPLSSTSRARFIQELDAVFNPTKYPQAKLDGILKDIQAIFQDNGLARLKAMAISDDVKAIAAEIQKGGAQ